MTYEIAPQPAPLFDPGRTLATPAAVDVCGSFAVGYALRRHLLGQWGDVGEALSHANAAAIEAGTGRIVSAHALPPSNTQCLMVITEADRTTTTVRLLHAD